MPAICVYCGSSPGLDPRFLEAAVTVGTLIGRAGHTLVYGGGNVGLMGAVADAALAAGGEVIGVIPENLVQMELAHQTLTTLHVVESMHARKLKMATLADCFLALPGGIGTLEEIIEVSVWTQLGVHLKPCAILNVAGFYDPLAAFLRGMVTSRFLRAEQLDQIIIETDPAVAIDRILTTQPVTFYKWVDRNIAQPREADESALE